MLSVIGVLVIGLIAAGAVVAAQQAPAKRTLAIPPTLLGMPQFHTPELDAVMQDVVSKLRSQSVVSGADGAYFGDGNSQLPTLFAGYAQLKRRPNASERTQFSRANQFDVGGEAMNFVPVPPGPFGGQMLCGDLTGAQSVRICVSIDNGAVVYTGVALSGTTDADADLLARQIISAVEK